MANGQRFRNVNAWREGHQLALYVYRLTRQFPDDEKFALTNQLRRAAVSVTSNIAEGFNRFSLKEKVQFYSISLGSVSEIQSQLLLAKDLGYVSDSSYNSAELMTDTIHKLLSALIRSLRR